MFPQCWINLPPNMQHTCSRMHLGRLTESCCNDAMMQMPLVTMTIATTAFADAALILLPLSGLMIAALYSQDIKSGPLQDVTLAIHGFAASLSYVMIATHVSAAIYSRMKGEGVWSSMVPILKEDGPTSNPIVEKIIQFEQTIYDKIDHLVSTQDQE